eukprot:9482593-Pyramimonas_sp.AAC.1
MGFSGGFNRAIWSRLEPTDAREGMHTRSIQLREFVLPSSLASVVEFALASVVGLGCPHMPLISGVCVWRWLRGGFVCSIPLQAHTRSQRRTSTPEVNARTQRQKSTTEINAASGDRSSRWGCHCTNCPHERLGGLFELPDTLSGYTPDGFCQRHSDMIRSDLRGAAVFKAAAKIARHASNVMPDALLFVRHWKRDLFEDTFVAGLETNRGGNDRGQRFRWLLHM